MADVVVVEVNGEALVERPETGEKFTASENTTLLDGDSLTIPDGITVLVSIDGIVRELPAGQTVTFPLQLAFSDVDSDDEFAVFDDSVEDLNALLDQTGDSQDLDQDFLDVLAGDDDILESLEATAAGLDGGGGAGGSNFVRVDRINENVDPVAFEFEQGANDNEEITSEQFGDGGDEATDITITLDAIPLNNDATPTLLGNTDATPDSTVTLTVTDSAGNVQTLTTTVQADGTFSVDVPVELAEGEYSVEATVTDAAGNTATDANTGEIDTTAPVISLDAQGTDNDTTPTLSGTTDATPGSTVTLTVTDSAGNVQTLTTTVQADGSFSIDVPVELAEGEYSVEASVTDAAGNTASDANTGEIDTTAPVISLDAQGTDNDTTPTLSGTTDAAPGSTITLTVTDSAGNVQTLTTTVQADGTFSVDVPAALAESEYSVEATVTDAAGNTATDANTGEIDTNAPVISLDAQGTDNDSTPTLSGTTDAAPGSTVTLTVTDSAGNVQTLTTTVQADGTFSVDVPVELAEGEYSVEATVTDAAGNTATDANTGEIDTTAPVISLDSQGTDNDTTPTFSGTTDAAPGSTVILTVTDSSGNVQTLTTTVQADGTFSVDVPDELAEGEYSVEASVTDAAGNTATDANTGEIDTTAPAISLDAQGTDNDTTPTLSGTTDAAPGSTITLTVTDSAGNVQTLTTTVQADGTFSGDVPVELAEGEYSVEASVTDAAGNTATDSLNAEIDITGPTISLNDPGINGDSTPTISGLTDALPGSTITFTVTDSAGNSQTFTTVVQANGTFSVDVPAALAEGIFEISASVADELGNTSEALASGDYNASSPSTVIEQPAPTNETTPTVSGDTDAPAGSVVVIVVTDSEGNEQIITTTVGADGTFSEDVPAELSDGEFTVDVTVTTPDGDSSSSSVTGEVDTTAPIIYLDAIGTTNDDTPIITGNSDAEAGSEVTVEILHSDGSTQTLTAIVQADGSFSVEVPLALADGDFTVNASVTDTAGNTSSTSIDAAINVNGPTVVTEPVPVTNGSEGVSGNTDTPNSDVVVVITDDEGNSQTVSGSTDENGDFTVDLPDGLDDGEYTVDVTVTDDDGNSSTTTTTTVIDTTEPVISIDPQTDTNDATPSISGSTDLMEGSEVTITVTDSEGNEQVIVAVVDDTGNFTTDITDALPEGEYTVTVTATDEAGNTTTATETGGNVDTTEPSLTVNPLTTGNDGTPSVSGSTDLPPGSTVILTVTDSAGNEQTITAIVDEDGNFNAETTTPLTEGEFSVEATVTDDAGNTTTVTETGGSIDTQVPIVSLNPAGTGNDTTPTISGTTDLPVGSEISLTVTDSEGNTQTFSASVESDGSFSADVPSAMLDGNFTIEATATDNAGNATTATETGTIDTNVPALSLTPLGNDNDTTPTISGTTDLPTGSTVTLTVTDALGNSQTFTAGVDTNGNFSADVPSPLAEGDYDVTATATDTSGNTASTTETGGNIDVTSPLVNLDAQGSTNDATPTISGTTDQALGSTVSISVTDSEGNSQTFTTTVDENGTFSVEVPANLADGEFTVTATVSDDAGNQDTASTNGTIDTAAPTLNLDSLSNDNDTTPAISGTSDLPEGSAVTLVITDGLGNQQTIEVSVDDNGNFSAEVPSALAEGDYSVTATATDTNGNTASTTQTGGTVDTAAPVITLNEQGTGNDATPTLSGNSDLPQGSIVTLTVTDSAGDTQTINALVNTDGSFSIDVPLALAEGDYTVTATAQDEAGNQTSVTQNGSIDTNAPTLSLNPLTESNDNTPVISGSTSLPEGSTVSISVTDDEGNTQTFIADVDAQGNFSAEVQSTLPDGDYSVTVNATDPQGNTASVTETGGAIDTTPPTLSLNDLGSGNDTTPTLSGNTDLPEGSLVSLQVTDSEGNVQTINTLVDADGNFSVDVPTDLADGDYTVEASATDANGNSETAVTTGTVDATAPELTLTPQSATNDVTPTISGTTDVEPGSLVTITVVDSDGNSQTFQATVQNDGSFEADVPNALTEGDYTVTATVTDTNGNQAIETEAGGNVDSQAPTLTVNPLDTGNDNTPTLSGSTNLPEGSVVVITVTDSIGDTQTINALVDDSGNFITDVLTPLAEGDYTVSVTATDEAGNATTQSETGGNVDLTAPVLSLSPQGTGNDVTPSISGNTDLAPGSTVTLSVTDSNGNTQTFTAEVDSNGNFSADIPIDLADGDYTVTASVTDDAGNTTTTTDSGSIDTSAPSLTLDAQTVGNDTTPTLTGTTDLPSGSTVTISVTDSAGTTQTIVATVDSDGNFSATVPTAMAEGDYTVTAFATDTGGNAASVTDNNGSIDVTPPIISVDAPDATNDVTPTINGSSDLPTGSAITLTVTDSAGNIQTLTATIDSDGNFSVEVPLTMSEGDFTVTATATDEAGNSASANTTGSIDTLAPSLTLDPQGNSNDTTPTISGTTDLPEGSFVTISVTDSTGHVQEIQATVDADGNFSADIPGAVSEGNYSVEVTATDDAGNTAVITSNAGNIDTTAPELSLNPLTPQNNTTPTVSGTSDLPEGITVTITVIDSQGDTQTLFATVDSDGNFSVDITTPLPEGDYTITASATDEAGNSSSVAETGGSVDTTAPTVSLTPQGTGSDSTPAISGTTDLPSGSTVSITVTDSAGNSQTFTASVDDNGNFNTDVPDALADGDFVVTATAIDEAGNSASDSANGTIDANAPTLTLNALAVGNDVTPIISGTTDLPEGSTVTLTLTDSAGDTQTFFATVQFDGTFSAEVPANLPEGDYSVTASAIDTSGNSASVTENGGSIDTTAPIVTLDPQSTDNNATPTISGTSNLAEGESVTITVTDSEGNIQTFVASISDDGSYSIEVPDNLAEGNYTVEVTATDDAGNTITVSDNDGTIDTIPPTLSIDPQGPTSDTTPTISGTTDLPAGSTVTIVVLDSDNVSHTFTARVQNDGSYQADVPSSLAQGNYSVAVTATDEAGNQAPATDGNGDVDSTPPIISLDPVSSGNNDTPVLSGTTDLSEGSTISFVVTDGNGNSQTFTTTVGTDGAFSIEIPTSLSDGTYNVSVSATDPAGNSSTVTDTGVIDASAPSIAIDPLGQTNDATPLISGTTDAPTGSTVTLTITDSAGNVQTFTTTVQSDGTFSESVPNIVAEGGYTIEAQVADSAGNIGSDTETGGLVDTTSPIVDVFEQGLGNDATPTVTGTTDQPAGSTVSITVTDSAGDSQTFSATVQIDGSFSADVPDALADGAYSVQTTVTDEAGNSATDSETGTLDTQAPIITLNDPGVGSDTTPTINGNVDLPEGSTVQITVVDNAGNSQTFTALVAANGSFSVEVPAVMAEGSFTVSASATDSAGNSANANETGVIDVTAPELTVDVVDSTNDTTPLISGTTSEPQGTVVTITVTDSAGAIQTLTAIVQSDGTYSVATENELAEGNYTVNATVSDAAGNSASASDSGEIDTTAPTLVIDPIDVTSDDTPTISGSTDLGLGTIVLITVTSSAGIEQTIAAVVQVDGSWSVDVPLPLTEGEFTVQAQVLDEAGNIINVSVDAEVDTTAPIISIDQNGVINTATPEISGSVNVEEGTEVLVTIIDSNGDAQILTAIVDEFGDFSVNVPDALAEGILSVQVDVTDPAGNSAVETTLLDLDLTGSSITLDLTADTVSDLPVVSGVTDAVAGTPVIIVISQNGSVVVTINAEVLPDGTFAGNVPVSLNEGSTTIEVTVDDGVSHAVTTEVEIDLTAPLLTLDSIGITNDVTPIITGTCNEIGATIVIVVTASDGSEQTLNATVQPDGSYSIAVPTDLPEGITTIVAEVTDAAGNTISTSVSGEIDLTLPNLTVDITNVDSLTPTISGLSEAGATVTIVLLDSAGNETLLTALVQGDGTYSITVPSGLPEGLLSVNVSVLDSAGNLATIETSGIIDVTLPLINLDTLVLDNLQPTISGISELIGSEVTIELTDGNGGIYVFTTIVQNDGTFSINVPTNLAQGLLNVEASVIDGEGHLASVVTSGILDLSIPALELNTLVLDSLTPTISGTCDRIGETVTIVLTDGAGVVQTLTAVVQNNGFFSVDVPADLSEGLLDVEVSVLGSDGNLITVDTSGTLDLTLPVLQLDTLNLDSFTPTITGISELIGQTITIVLTDSSGALQTLTGLVQNDGTFSIAVPTDLSQGLLDIDVSVLGSDGNLVTLNTSGIVDVNLPLIQLDTIDGTTLTPIISGISELIGSTVELTLTDPYGTSTLVSVIVQDDGTFTYEVPSDLQQGLLQVEASVLDTNGNIVTADVSGIINVSLSELSIGALDFNSATPVITGISEFIGKVISLQITDGSGAVQTVTGLVANDGTFSIPITVDLADGLLTVDATVLDTDNSTLANITTTGLIDVNLDVLSLDTLDFASATPTITGISEFIGKVISLQITDGSGATQTVTGLVG
ncbi:Ig-like domain repeat protein, partial [Alteromonas sp. MMG017]